MASGTHCSRRSWETSGAFWARWPFHEHAWFNDGRLSFLTLLAPGASNPFIDGVLVCGHAWPDLRWGNGRVVVGVIVVLIQVPDGFLSEVPIWILIPFSWSRVGGVGAKHGAGGEPQVGELVGVPAIAKVLIWRWRVVVIGGHVVIITNAGVFLLASPLTGIGHRRGGHRGRQGQVLSDLRGLSGNFHRLLGWRGVLVAIIRVFIIGVLVVISVPFTLSYFWVIFIGVGVLRLGGIGDRDVTVRAVVLAVIIGCPVV